MLRSRTTILLLTAVVLATACDRTPVDPTDGGIDIATMLFGAEAARHAASPLSLPSLVQAAVLEVYTGHGAVAARGLVTDLQRMQERARGGAASADREAALAHRSALRDEQLAIVLRVFGDNVAMRVVDAVRTDAATVDDRVAALDPERPAAARAHDLLARVAELMADAETAAANGAYRASLDAATQAAGHVDAVRAAILESMRVPALDELFETATMQVGRNVGHDAAQQLLGEYRRLQQAAQQAVRTGSREQAHAALAAARTEEIAVVLRVLGDDAARRLLGATTAAHTALAGDVAAARTAGRDVARIERMLSAAGDMLGRASASLGAGNAAAALDLGSHAAGLVNGARSTLGTR